MELIQELEAKDKGLAATVKRFFRDIAKLLKDTINAYKGYKPDSDEGRMVMQMKDIYSQLQEIFAEGIYEGGENHMAMGAQKNTTDEGGVRFNRRAFNKTVDDIVYSDDNKPFDHRNVFMGETPQVLVNLGFPQLPMTITSKHIYTIANSSGRFNSSNDHYHKLGAEGVKALVDAIQKPVVTFVEKDNQQRIVMITMYNDSLGNSVMVAIECSGQTRFKAATNELQIYANPLTTALGKKDTTLANYLTEALEEGRVLQADKKRSQESPSGVWARCPESLWSTDFTTNIERFRQNVKRFLPKEKQIRKAWQAVEDAQTDKIKESARKGSNATVGEVLQQENAQLKKDIDRLKELLKLQKTVTGGTKFTDSSVEAVARYLKKQAGAKGDTAEFATLLHKFYEGIAAGKDLTWESVREMAQEATDWLQSHVVLKKEISEYAQDILRDVRSSRIRLDESQKAEAAYRYGSFNAYRQAAMGSVIIANDGIMLDEKWQQWADQYPDVFDADITASDMPDVCGKSKTVWLL